MTRTEKAMTTFDKKYGKKKMKTRNKILLICGAFLGVNFFQAWLSWWLFRAVPDALLPYACGMTGLEALGTIALTLTEVIKEKKE